VSKYLTLEGGDKMEEKERYPEDLIKNFKKMALELAEKIKATEYVKHIEIALDINLKRQECTMNVMHHDLTGEEADE